MATEEIRVYFQNTSNQKSMNRKILFDKNEHLIKKDEINEICNELDIDDVDSEDFEISNAVGLKSKKKLIFDKIKNDDGSVLITSHEEGS